MELAGGFAITGFGAVAVFGGCTGLCQAESSYEIGIPDAASES